MGLGSGNVICGSALDQAAWRSYEAVEEAWIRDRHALLLEQCPECAESAALDLELKLAELHRRGLQFLYLSKYNPHLLRGGMWQLASLPMSANDLTRMLANSPAYRRQEERIRQLTEELRQSAQYDDFRRAQMRLWKTPEYHSVHRRYTGRLQELNRIHSGSAAGAP
jgi:hypothetical protein